MRLTKENLQWKAQDTGFYTKEGHKVFLFDGPVARVSLPENSFVVRSYQIMQFKKMVQNISFLRKTALEVRKSARRGFAKKSVANNPLIKAVENKKEIKRIEKDLSYIKNIADNFTFDF